MNTFRVHALVGLSILSLAFIAPAAQAKKEDPPVNQGKAPLKMSSPSVLLSHQTVTISWSTNTPANTSISVATVGSGSPSIVLDEALTRHHEISIGFLSSGLTYEYIAVSVTESGEIVLARGSFVAL
jgi:hypothetical protein